MTTMTRMLVTTLILMIKMRMTVLIIGQMITVHVVHCCTRLSVGMSCDDRDKEPRIVTKIIYMGN